MANRQPSRPRQKAEKPITLQQVSQGDYLQMETKVQKLENTASKPDEAQRKRLEAGDILREWKPLSEGRVEELTRGVIDMPLEDFLRKMPVREWGQHVASYVGGSVQPDGADRQVERMVLRMPGKDLDMTKVEGIHEERDAQGNLIDARVRWEVKKSDNGTVPEDVGSVHFERFGNKTLVTWHSVHQYDKMPFNLPMPAGLKNQLLGFMLGDYFKRSIEAYRELAKS